jgi:hypothetical protein
MVAGVDMVTRAFFPLVPPLLPTRSSRVVFTRPLHSYCEAKRDDGSGMIITRCSSLSNGVHAGLRSQRALLQSAGRDSECE